MILWSIAEHCGWNLLICGVKMSNSEYLFLFENRNVNNMLYYISFNIVGTQIKDFY